MVDYILILNYIYTFWKLNFCGFVLQEHACSSCMDGHTTRQRGIRPSRASRRSVSGPIWRSTSPSRTIKEMSAVFTCASWRRHDLERSVPLDSGDQQPRTRRTAKTGSGVWSHQWGPFLTISCTSRFILHDN